MAKLHHNQEVWSTGEDDPDAVATLPVGPPAACNSEAIIELPESLQVVPGPSAVSFCGFLDAQTDGFDEAERDGDDDTLHDSEAAMPRLAKMLPPPPAEIDLEEQLD